MKTFASSNTTFRQHGTASSSLQKLPIALAIASALGASASANADDIKELPLSQAKVQTEKSYKIDRSSSIKNTPPLLDTAKSITVIPESVMKDRGVDSLRDALRSVSGITMSAGEGGTPTGDSMSIRGFSARTDIYVDGIRDIAGYSRDTFNVEAVEVAKGPASATTGRGSTGGSVNMVSKSAKLENFNDVALRLGTENDYRTTLDSNFAVGESTALRINLLADDGEVAGRDEIENNNLAAAVSLVTGIDTDTRFSVNADYQKQDNLPDYGIPWVSNSVDSDPVAELAPYEGEAPPVKFSNFYGNVDRDFEEIEAASLTLKLEHDLSDSTLLRTQARVGSVARESVTTAPRFLDLKTSTDVRQSSIKTRDTEDSLAAIQFDLVGNYQIAGLTHDIVTGVEFYQENFKRWNLTHNDTDNLSGDASVVDLYNPNSHLAYTGQYHRDGSSIEAKTDTRAIYIFDTITLNSQWKLSGGVRVEEFDVDYQHDYDDPSLQINTSDSMTSWNLSAVYKPADNGSIYFGAGNSFNPSGEGLTISTRGNLADLEPEETDSYELGTKWDLLDNKLLASAAIFRSEKSNARTDDPFAENSRDETLGGKQRVDGFELSVTGNISEQFMLIGSYTYQKSEVLEAAGDDAEQIGKELPRTPKNSASLWGHYDFNDKLAAGVGAQYVGASYNSSTPSSREQADDYLIFDMMVSYQITDQFGLQLNGSNLTDEEYIDQLGGGHFVPGEGRYLSLSGTFSF